MRSKLWIAIWVLPRFVHDVVRGVTKVVLTKIADDEDEGALLGFEWKPEEDFEYA